MEKSKQKIYFNIISALLLLPIALSFNIDFVVLPTIESNTSDSNIVSIIEPFGNNGTNIYRSFLFIPLTIEEAGEDTSADDFVIFLDEPKMGNKTIISEIKKVGLNKILIMGISFLILVSLAVLLIMVIIKNREYKKKPPIVPQKKQEEIDFLD